MPRRLERPDCASQIVSINDRWPSYSIKAIPGHRENGDNPTETYPVIASSQLYKYDLCAVLLLGGWAQACCTLATQWYLVEGPYIGCLRPSSTSALLDVGVY